MSRSGGGGSAAYATARPAEGAVVVALGHSFTVEPPILASSGYSQWKRVAGRLNASLSTSEGVDSARMVDTALLAMNGFGTASKKIGTPNRGLFLLDCETNDMVNPQSGAVLFGALTAPQVNVFRLALRAVLAMTSASARVEEPIAGLPAGWATSAYNGCSGGAFAHTTTPGAALSYPPFVVPASGKVYALSTLVAGGGDFAYSVGATQVANVSNAALNLPASLFTQVATNNPGAGGWTFFPSATLLDLSAYTGTSVTVTITKTDSGAGQVNADALLLQDPTPAPVLVQQDPQLKATAPAGWPATAAANKALLDPVIAAVTSEFPSAILFAPPLDPTTHDIGSDGVHPADRGMRKIADSMLAALDAWLTTQPGDDYDGLYATS